MILNARDFGGRQRLLREQHSVFRIGDDVDFFSAQFANNGLHAHALHAHARAHRIPVVVAALHRDLLPLAGFARGGANLHGAVINFRHFHLKKALH